MNKPNTWKENPDTMEIAGSVYWAVAIESVEDEDKANIVATVSGVGEKEAQET